jgi:D-beta-D-heptose 7-phosphate kinase / D-beta-D-heptose 1-phosphate adenosyltransferase
VTAPLVVVGDALLDRDVVGRVERISPDAPVPVVDEEHVGSRPGGAGLAAVLAADGGRPVTLVTALGRDAAGGELLALIEERGVQVIDLGLDGPTPEKVRVGSRGRPLVRLDRGGAASPVGEPDAQARAAIAWADAVLVSDYGRGVTASPGVREALAAASGPVVWDPHPKGARPVADVVLATPNLAEARALGASAEGSSPPGAEGPRGGEPRAEGPLAAADYAGLPAAARLARSLIAHWGARAIAVTCGARGAMLVERGRPPLAVPAQPAPGGDPCGAGDRFASHAACALADGAGVADAVLTAVACASRFVAAGGASALAAAPSAPAASHADPLALAHTVRAAGGTVVAAGGCFDLLHPGHVRTLEAARALGDCLVVCLNSDASVKRLKGPGRPVLGVEDRAAVLLALRCVDAVLVFDEDTPAAVLERLRPHVWAKGSDYGDGELPEAGVLSRWGGEIVRLPLLDGKSTSRIIEEATLRAV